MSPPRTSIYLVATLCVLGLAACVSFTKKERNFVKSLELYKSDELRFTMKNDYQLFSSKESSRNLLIAWNDGDYFKLPVVGNKSGLTGRGLRAALVPEDFASRGGPDALTPKIFEKLKEHYARLLDLDRKFDLVEEVSQESEPYPVKGLPGATMHRLTWNAVKDRGKVGKERREAVFILDVLIGYKPDRVFVYTVPYAHPWDLPDAKLFKKDAEQAGYAYELERRDYVLASLEVLD